MLHDKVTITAPDDFPGLRVEVRRPLVPEWSEVQETIADGNHEEGYLNLLIACGKVVADQGVSVSAHFGELCDDWRSRPELACGEAAIMAGTFKAGLNATELNLPAILPAAERVRAGGTAPGDIAPAELAAACATFGLDAETMRTICACNAKRGSYSA